ncbi:thiamine diphosphate-binding protein [Aspergillus avenaceus]|uniref:Pyruvate decarboxylase n=1 Tax=Aspergillus avenaceus TaxID=36643 RepID=A0A5N6TZ79_ASPAV|nr:thiamine diphosphate-binding protein [Aspergillus avenaceus]
MPVKLAEYLFHRLRQLGIGSIHGVPGDFNLTLLDYVEPAGLRWVGNANELNAAYASDGYARIKGVGALITTFGVGELSAVNAIAGAYAERAPVVHIVGTPERALQDARKLIHHAFNDGEYRRFAQIHSHLTVAQTNLWDLSTCPEQIDEVLKQCLLHSRPVYIEVPVDLVDKEVCGERLATPIRLPETTQSAARESVLARVIERIYAARQPIIVVDGESRPLGILDDLQQLTQITDWPTWSTGFGKGLLNETLPNFHGIYRGSYDNTATQRFVTEADLVLCFGPHHSSSNTFNYSNIPKDEATIFFTDSAVKLGTETVDDTYHGTADCPFSDIPGKEAINQDRLWRLLANFLRPGDIVLGETGTAGFGVRDMALPIHARVFTHVTWLSIGYMLPAAQGAALAQEELVLADDYHGLKDARAILFIGDGSFQMTAQELATIIRHKLNVVVFLINNDGYTVERCIHGRHQGYNDVAAWRYLRAPGLFGAHDDTFTGSARTWEELQRVLDNDTVRDGTGLRMIEVFLDREDAPTGPLLGYLQSQREREA